MVWHYQNVVSLYLSTPEERIPLSCHCPSNSFIKVRSRDDHFSLALLGKLECVCVCVCACVHACVSVCVCMCACMCVCVCVVLLPGMAVYWWDQSYMERR